MFSFYSWPQKVCLCIFFTTWERFFYEMVKNHIKQLEHIFHCQFRLIKKYNLCYEYELIKILFSLVLKWLRYSARDWNNLVQKLAKIIFSLVSKRLWYSVYDCKNKLYTYMYFDEIANYSLSLLYLTLIATVSKTQNVLAL